MSTEITSTPDMLGGVTITVTSCFNLTASEIDNLAKHEIENLRHLSPEIVDAYIKQIVMGKVALPIFDENTL